MRIRLMIDVAIDTKEHAQLIYDAIKDHIGWFDGVNDNEDYYICFMKCHHDETPFQPCTQIEEWRNGEVTWHNGEPAP